MSDFHAKSPTPIPAADSLLEPPVVRSAQAHAQGAIRGSSRETSTNRLYRHPIVVALLFGLAALLLLLVGIGRPGTMFFDEGYYVPEARALAEGSPNPAPVVPALSKPPLAKVFIAMGMEITGDNSFGWRVIGGVSGALTVVAVYLWTYLLTGNRRPAFLAAWLTLFNNFLFVMSRIATADVFLLLFLMWSLVAYTASLTLDLGASARRLLFCLSGLLMGLAGAAKWNAVDSLGVYFLVTFALLWVSKRGLEGRAVTLSSYARNVRQIGLLVVLAGLIVAPAASYSLAFWPSFHLMHLPFNLHDLASVNRFIWNFDRTIDINPAITSHWYSWPLNITPFRALSYLLGNPVVTWGGLLALALCTRRFWSQIAIAEGLIVLLFASNYLQWGVTPQKGLYYYYYYPCVMMLGVAVAVAMRGLPTRVFGLRSSLIVGTAASLVFLWCYPRMAHLGAPWDCMLGCWR